MAKSACESSVHAEFTLMKISVWSRSESLWRNFLVPPLLNVEPYSILSMVVFSLISPNAATFHLSISLCGGKCLDKAVIVSTTADASIKTTDARINRDFTRLL
jgi:hypothetical protein